MHVIINYQLIMELDLVHGEELHHVHTSRIFDSILRDSMPAITLMDDDEFSAMLVCGVKRGLKGDDIGRAGIHLVDGNIFPKCLPNFWLPTSPNLEVSQSPPRKNINNI